MCSAPGSSAPPWWTTPARATKLRTASAPRSAMRNFAWFGTTSSKNRGNFLDLLRAGDSDYVINAEALTYMRQRALAGPVIAPIIEGRQPRSMTVKRLLQGIPCVWTSAPHTDLLAEFFGERVGHSASCLDSFAEFVEKRRPRRSFTVNDGRIAAARHHLLHAMRL